MAQHATPSPTPETINMSLSKAIDSPQSGPYERWKNIVTKHLEHDYRKPVQQHNRDAYEIFERHISSRPGTRLILDSCCGTGLSTLKLAENNPDAFVIGIDQSKVRLAKHHPTHQANVENMLLLRTNCEDFWRLCEKNKIRFEQHYILYPNPYPKPEHFKRRWHGHPVFPVLGKLSHSIELRSNWRIYLDEFALAWQHLSGSNYPVCTYKPIDAMTLFERKYSASGQALFQLHIKREPHELPA